MYTFMYFISCCIIYIYIFVFIFIYIYMQIGLNYFGCLERQGDVLPPWLQAFGIGSQYGPSKTHRQSRALIALGSEGVLLRAPL